MINETIDIMLVEDDEVDIMQVQRAFGKHHITNTLHVARNGIEALAMLRGEGHPKLIPLPKIILLDINMPMMNGLEFLAQLRADPELHAISILILTTSSNDQDRIAAFELNVAGYILKPIDTTKFMESIRVLNMFWSLTEYP